MSYFRYPGRTVFLVALALALGGTAISAQPRPAQLPPGPGGPGGPPGRGGPPPMAPPKPYKPVAVSLPQPYSDPSFEAFRKELGDIASHKDRAALAGKVVANGFFWMGEKGDKANKRKSGIDNDGRNSEGWEILTAAASEATLEPIPDKKGVMCSPAGPVFDQKAAEQTAKATGTSPMDWGFPVKGSLDVHAAGQASSPVIEKVGAVLVRVMPEGPPPGAGDAPPPKPGASFVRVVTPSGKVGYVVDDAIGALDSDHACGCLAAISAWAWISRPGAGANRPGHSSAPAAFPTGLYWQRHECSTPRDAVGRIPHRPT
jgi:hypothetical protein